MNVYIVRHVESIGNKKKFLQGRLDTDITEKGEYQLDLISKSFDDIDFDIIFSSNLKRASLTAQAINRNKNKDIIYDERLLEINISDWQGKTFDDISKLYPNEFYVWQNFSYNFKLNSSESMIDVYNRTKDFCDVLLKNHKNKNIVLVSHGCTIRNLICNLLDFDIENIDKFYCVDNASITCINIFEDKKILNYFNMCKF